MFEEKDENIDINAPQTKRDEKVPMPIMLDVDSDDDNYDNIIDSALDKAPEKDLVDLAGILGEFKEGFHYFKLELFNFNFFRHAQCFKSKPIL